MVNFTTLYYTSALTSTHLSFYTKPVLKRLSFHIWLKLFNKIFTWFGSIWACGVWSVSFKHFYDFSSFCNRFSFFPPTCLLCNNIEAQILAALVFIGDIIIIWSKSVFCLWFHSEITTKMYFKDFKSKLQTIYISKPLVSY